MTESAAQIDTPAGDESSTTDDNVTLLHDDPAQVEADAKAAVDAKAAEDAETAETEVKAKADAVADKAEAKPTEYTDFTMPEGVEMDADLSGELKGLANEYKLDQDGAQKFADLGAKLMQKQSSALADSVAQWAVDTKADKEIGGDGFDENLAIAAKARDAFGTPELTELLDGSGLGNHPEMVRWFVRVGKAIGEDRLVAGNVSTTAAEATHEKRLYPEMN